MDTIETAKYSDDALYVLLKGTISIFRENKPGDRSDKACAQPQRRSPDIGHIVRIGGTAGRVVRGSGLDCVPGGK